MRFFNFLIPFFFFANIFSAPLETTEIMERDYAILTEFFTLIVDTNVAPSLVKLLAGNKITEPILVDAIVAFLKALNLTDLLEAVDTSGLTVDIILRALQDSSFFPGLYNIVDGLKNGDTTTPSTSNVDTVSLVSDISSIASNYEQLASDGLSSVLSEVSDTLGIGTGTGIISYLNPVFELLGLGTTGSTSSSEISLSPSASAAATGAAATGATSGTATGTATATTAGTTTGATKTAGTATTTSATKTSSTATASSTSSSSSSSSSWWLKILGQVEGWLSKRELENLKRGLEKREFNKRDNQVLDNLLESLEKSGLAMQVIVPLIEDSDNAPFMRDLITSIVKNKAITLDGLKSALDTSNLLNDGIIDTLSSSKLGITIS